ncbi:DUF4230 domain-containing protein [Corynebacterium sp. HS2168-gen11]|uniref:DUF4230 domain-containing protein n=1 Tax=Corynebacterium sp. HS2168-gen11 TaxID=2974027 RepID=UPI00216B26E9|nr:DUF4230 domain-containing protein [Corynebacterium sp. HS2168-gen11]MCS4535685.1 DUF4230 domain-containing protein [Corynebacterium sp. HS2168-gen11]
MPKFLIKAAVTLVATVALVFMGIFALSKAGLFDGPVETITSSTIGGSFEQISELSVEEYNFTNVGRFENEGHKLYGLTVPLTGKHFLISYDGVVKAGIRDFTAIDVEMNDAAQKIVVTAPKVEITNSTIEPASVVVYDQSMNPLNQINVRDLTKFLSDEEKNAEEKAIKLGLIDRATTRAETLIKSHVEALLDGTDKNTYSVEVHWR